MPRPLPQLLNSIKDLLGLIDVIKDPKRYEPLLKELRDLHGSIRDDLQGVESKVEADRILLQARAKKQEVDALTETRSKEISQRVADVEADFASAKVKLDNAVLKEAQVKRAVSLSAEKYCSASIMMAAAGVQVSHSYEIVELDEVSTD